MLRDGAMGDIEIFLSILPFFSFILFFFLPPLILLHQLSPSSISASSLLFSPSNLYLLFLCLFSFCFLSLLASSFLLPLLIICSSSSSSFPSPLYLFCFLPTISFFLSPSSSY